MITREHINEELESISKSYGKYSVRYINFCVCMLLEVMLDIRDILQEQLATNIKQSKTKPKMEVK